MVCNPSPSPLSVSTLSLKCLRQQQTPLQPYFRAIVYDLKPTRCLTWSYPYPPVLSTPEADSMCVVGEAAKNTFLGTVG